MNNDFSLDDIYFKDAFTQTGDKLNLEVNNACVECITSKNNKFSLDEEGNLVVNSITYNESNVPDALDFNQIYPVGSIYLSTVNINPSTTFGGTWIQIKDKFLLAAGDEFAGGTTGGEKTHTLTNNELPKISVSIFRGAGNQEWCSITGAKNSDGVYLNSYHITGNNQPHNNMPPYLTVYMWQRTA